MKAKSSVVMKKTLTIFVQTALLFIPGLAFADATGPEISPVSPLSAFYDVAQTYTVTADDADGVAGCELLVSSIYRTPMTYDSVGDRWTVSYTFTTRRSANSIRAVCTDGAGNEVNGPSRIITVAEVPTEETDGSASGTGTPPLEVDVTTWSSDAVVLLSPVLIKTRCPGGEDVNHPCRTVYFLDTLGVRHAFPNEATYFTWYSDWRNIYVVSDDAMTSYPIGRNVRYHPGKRLVKFPSVPVVYAVARHGVAGFDDAHRVGAERLYGFGLGHLGR